MLIEFIRAFSLIFFAEMGDKSQILAMTFATRYKLRNVIIGISLGIFLNHFLAVLIGVFIPNLFQITYLSFFAGLVFIIFGIQSLQVTENVNMKRGKKFSETITISIAIFLGELGDKTQLSTIVLASETSYPLLLLIATVSAMIITSLLGIFVGIKFGSKIPEMSLKIIASIIFIFFGFLKVFGNLPALFDQLWIIGLFSVAVLSVYVYMFIQYRKTYMAQTTLFKQRAEELKNYYKYIKDKLEDICLGVEKCQTCQGNFCLLGYTKTMVRNILENKHVKVIDLHDKVRKNFDQKKTMEALEFTLSVLKDDWLNADYAALHEIRHNFELLLFDEIIEQGTYEEYLQLLEIKKSQK